MKNNTFLRKALLLALIGVLVTMMVAPALASETLYISNSELNLTLWGNIYPTVNCTQGGRIFQGNDQYLTAVTFYLKNNSITETGSVRAVLFDNITVDAPTDASVPAEYSNATYDVSALYQATLVTFYFDDDTNLTSSQNWGVSLETASALGSTVSVGLSSGDGFCDLEGDRTFIDQAYAPIIYIYTNDEAAGGGTPYTPPGTADLTNWDNLISSFTSFIVPLMVILLPAFLLMFLTRRTDKWLLLIGITIGVGMGYYFMPASVPLWLVFLVTIGLIGMAYQSVRGGGAE